MVQKHLILLLSIIFFNYNFTDQFIYPVLDLKEDKILLAHQKKLDHLELWIFNYKTGSMVKALNDMYTPCEVKLFPGGHAFSFIDSGRFRVKEFAKRSVYSVDISDPIDSINSISLIDDQGFYFSGKFFGEYKIFAYNLQGDMISLLTGESSNFMSKKNIQGYDCLYPCKIDEQLFFVARDAYRNYSIKRKYLNKEQNLIKEDNPICFLCMHDTLNGMYLKNIPSKHEGFFKFICCQLKLKDESNWNKKELFEFELPIKMLTGNSTQRAIESLKLFKPIYDIANSMIYFSSYDFKSNKISLYNFDLNAFKVSRISTEENCGSFSSIIRVENKIFYGLHFQDATQKFIEQDFYSGTVACSLPMITLNE